MELSKETMEKMAGIMLTGATEKEKETYRKIEEMTDVQVFEQTGMTKDEIIEKFHEVWMMKAMQIALKEAGVK